MVNMFGVCLFFSLGYAFILCVWVCFFLLLKYSNLEHFPQILNLLWLFILNSSLTWPGCVSSWPLSLMVCADLPGRFLTQTASPNALWSDQYRITLHNITVCKLLTTPRISGKWPRQSRRIKSTSRVNLHHVCNVNKMRDQDGEIKQWLAENAWPKVSQRWTELH